jgi:hypothetical protein
MTPIVRTTRRRTPIAAAVAAGLALTLSACGGGDPTADEAAADEPAAAQEEDAQDPGEEDATGSAPESDDEAAAPGGEETQVDVGETIEDPDMGDTVEVLSAVRDFPSQEEAELVADGGEVVLLEVTVTPGEEYGGLVSMGNFKISWDDGADFWGNKTRMVEEEMDAAGYTPLEDVSRSDGGEHTGWMAFLVDERADTYLVDYERSGAEVIGSDEVIDAFQQEFEIPAP